MATTINLKKILDLPRWTFLHSSGATAPASGSCYSAANDVNTFELQAINTSTQHLYSSKADTLHTIPTPTTAFPTLAQGTAMACVNVGPTGSVPFNGTTTSFQLNEIIKANLRGYKVLITAGPGAGDIRTISGNTIGANGTVYVDTPFSASITTASSYRLLTPTWYVHVNSSSAGAFQRFDYVTQTWTARTIAPTAPSTEGTLTSTDCFFNNEFISLATGTATGGTSTTLVNSAKNWTTNQFANQQVRIVSGTGAGQIRSITSNTATELTVSGWATTPNSTSVYSIEGNQNHLYLGQTGSTVFYRYNIEANTWTTLTTRATVAGTCHGTFWIYKNSASHWNVENSLLNGRYLYSPRSSTAIDIYDIATNTWSSFTSLTNPSGTVIGMASNGSEIYSLYYTSTTQARVFKLDPACGASMIPVSTFVVNSGLSTGAGHRLRIHSFVDGNTKIDYLYYSLINLDVHYRSLILP
jgi:hypothetical protein